MTGVLDHPLSCDFSSWFSCPCFPYFLWRYSSQSNECQQGNTTGSSGKKEQRYPCAGSSHVTCVIEEAAACPRRKKLPTWSSMHTGAQMSIRKSAFTIYFGKPVSRLMSDCSGPSTRGPSPIWQSIREKKLDLILWCRGCTSMHRVELWLPNFSTLAWAWTLSLHVIIPHLWQNWTIVRLVSEYFTWILGCWLVGSNVTAGTTALPRSFRVSKYMHWVRHQKYTLPDRHCQKGGCSSCTFMCPASWFSAVTSFTISLETSFM